jgi:hypothetical protein
MKTASKAIVVVGLSLRRSDLFRHHREGNAVLVLR